MKIRLKLFAQLREALGANEIGVDMPDGATGIELWQWISQKSPTLPVNRENCRLAVNQEFSTFDAPLKDGDEVAILTPVAGG